MRRVKVAVIVLLLATATSPANSSCVQPVLADQIARADVIAYGTVTSSGQLLSFPPQSVFRFRVERLYKGDASGEVRVAGGPVAGAVTSVDYRAEDGTTHTLYLRRADAGFVTDSCSGSHTGAATVEEKQALGEGCVVAAASGNGLMFAATAGGLLVLALVVVVLLLRSRAAPVPSGG
jgi:hypothetical protein